jgi:hypothetical protein
LKGCAVDQMTSGQRADIALAKARTPSTLSAWRLRTLPFVLAIAALALLAVAGPALAATYDPLDVIPYDTFHASTSMTVTEIQAFLSHLSGPLKSVVATDHAGVANKTAAQIIWEAAHSQNLNPKVILATLQKEQSLLTVSNSSNAARLLKAMGCGVYGAIDPATGKTTNRYPGFGNQVWNGARLLSTYEATYDWFPGKSKTVTAYKTVSGKTVSYSTTIHPKNASTFALYTYTPYYPQKLIWDVYVQYFGDPHTQHPPVAVADVAKTPQDTRVSVSSPGVLGNDTDLDGDHLTAVVVAGTSHGTLALAADGGYTYAPAAGYRGVDSFTYRAYDGASYSATTTVTITVTPPLTTIGLATKSASSLGFGAAFAIAGTLETSVAVPGRIVTLQSQAPGSSFKDTSLRTTTGADGSFAFSVKPSTKTYYRVRFAASTDYCESYSTSVFAMPVAYAGVPHSAPTMSHSKTYSAYGYLKPRHSSGTYPVRIYLYRHLSTGWKSYGYVKAKASNYSSYSKCTAKLKLAYKGKWRLRLYAPADSGHAASWSEDYRYVTVK